MIYSGYKIRKAKWPVCPTVTIDVRHAKNQCWSPVSRNDRLMAKRQLMFRLLFAWPYQSCGHKSLSLNSHLFSSHIISVIQHETLLCYFFLTVTPERTSWSLFCIFFFRFCFYYFLVFQNFNVFQAVYWVYYEELYSEIKTFFLNFLSQKQLFTFIISVVLHL